MTGRRSASCSTSTHGDRYLISHLCRCVMRCIPRAHLRTRPSLRAHACKRTHECAQSHAHAHAQVCDRDRRERNTAGCIPLLPIRHRRDDRSTLCVRAADCTARTAARAGQLPHAGNCTSPRCSPRPPPPPTHTHSHTPCFAAHARTHTRTRAHMVHGQQIPCVSARARVCVSARSLYICPCLCACACVHARMHTGMRTCLCALAWVRISFPCMCTPVRPRVCVLAFAPHTQSECSSPKRSHARTR
jgi:hypothetical protein